MALTVPRAGINPGRAPQLANVPMPQSQAGGIAAAFGERMMQLGQQLENERLEREMTRLKTGMTKDLGELRLQVEDMGDPEQAGRAWDDGVSAIRGQYLDGQNDNGAPMVDPKLREDFGLAFDDLSTSQSLALGGRFLQLRQSQRMAQYYDYSNTVVSQAATTDPTTRGQLFADLDAEIDTRVARGDMTPEQGAVAKREARQTAENSRAIDLMQGDPQALADTIDGPEFGNLDPETKARYRASSQAEIARRQAAELKAAEAADRETRTAWGKRLDTVADIAANGQVAVDEVWLHSQPVAEMAARDPEFAQKRDEALAAISLRNEQPGIQQATPDQLAGMIEAERKRPLTAAYETKRVDVLQKQYDRALEGWRKDPISFAQKSGMAVPTLDLTNADSLPDAIAQRVTFAGGLREDGYAAEAGPLTQDEQTRLGAVIAGVTDPEERATLTGRIAASVIGRGGDPRDIDALAKDPVTKWVSLSQAHGAFGPALGGEILRGQEALAAKNLTLPPIADRMGPTYKMVEDMFAQVDGGEAIQAEVMAATDALYAARVRNIEPNSPIQKDIWRQALHEVMGGTGAYGTSRQRGGVQDVNGRSVFLPAGVSASMVTSAIRGLSNDLMPPISDTLRQIVGGQPYLNARNAARAEQILKSMGGGMTPGINGRPLTADDWAGATFAQVGPDQYALMLPYGGGVQAQSIEDGEAYTFSMSKLLAGYGGGAR